MQHSSIAVSGKSTSAWSYRSRACNTAGCDDWSAQRSVDVTRPPSGTGAFTVSWGSVSGAASYDLQERTGSGNWTLIRRL